MSLQKEVIKNSKNFINNNDLYQLKQYYNDILDLKIEYNINIEYLFKEVFYCACYNQNKEIILWLISIYNTFDDMTKIALRQIFIYAKYILINKCKDHTKTNTELLNWYQENIIIKL